LISPAPCQPFSSQNHIAEDALSTDVDARALAGEAAAHHRTAEDSKFGKRPSGNITLEGDGGGFEDSKDQTRPVWTATSTVSEAVKSGSVKNRVLSKTEQHLADTQAGNKRKFDVPMNTELGSDAAATSADEANQVNFDAVADEVNFKTETDEEFKSSVVADQASVGAKFITADGPEVKRLRKLGDALNIWRDEYEQAFELSNLQLLARFCCAYRTLAEGFRTWEDTTVHVRAACNRRVWSLQHWVHRQLSIAFDAWRQCLAKAQKDDLELRICTEDGIRFPITRFTPGIDHCGYSLRYKSPFPLFGLPVAAIGACQSIRDAC